MKKIIRYITVFSAICLLGLLLVACADTDASVDNQANTGRQQTHTVTIKSADLFDYYFSFSEEHKSSSNGVVGSSFLDPINDHSIPYGTTKSTSTITITPKLTGFVDYSGYVKLKATYSGSETKSNEVLEKRYINITQLGKGTDVYTLNSATVSDTTISFNDVTYEFYEADITVTYHHEGLSGNKRLSYKTIDITNYNYASYLSVSVYNKSEKNGSATIYYQQYTITPSNQITGPVEFNNVKITFDNGITLALDALGRASYQSGYSDTETPIPNLVSIEGCIDFYPPATYSY